MYLVQQADGSQIPLAASAFDCTYEPAAVADIANYVELSGTGARM
jgi:hypothetical protein